MATSVCREQFSKGNKSHCVFRRGSLVRRVNAERKQTFTPSHLAHRRPYEHIFTVELRSCVI